MSPLVLAALFALGAVMASFMGVVAARLHTGESIWRGRSRCDACGATLRPRALIPVFSFLFGQGRAGCCGARISPVAPFSELALGIVFALSYLKLGLVLALPFALLSFALLFALVLYDFAHQILPTPLLAAFVVSAGFAGWLSAPFPDALYATALVAVVIGGSLALIHVFSRGRAMGLADAPLSFGLSLLTGTAAVPGFLFSFWIGALVGITILLKRAPGSRMGIEVPFAPYLAAGFILAYFTQWNPFPLL